MKNRSLQANIMNWSTIIGLLLTTAFIIYGFKTGIFSSHDAMKAFLFQFGIWGPIIFITIQAIQVVIPILPGAIGCFAGVIIFGPVLGFAYNYVGICIGSVIAFLISKKYGKPVVRGMVKQKTYDKYITWLDNGKKFDRLFAIAIFSPIAPDDFLCYLAGLTSMGLKKFTGIILLCKPFSILVYSFGLSGIWSVCRSLLG